MACCSSSSRLQRRGRSGSPQGSCDGCGRLPDRRRGPRWSRARRRRPRPPILPVAAGDFENGGDECHPDCCLGHPEAHRRKKGPRREGIPGPMDGPGFGRMFLAGVGDQALSSAGFPMLGMPTRCRRPTRHPARGSRRPAGTLDVATWAKWSAARWRPRPATRRKPDGVGCSSDLKRPSISSPTTRSHSTSAATSTA
jgi:hypothetical protein